MKYLVQQAGYFLNKMTHEVRQDLSTCKKKTCSTLCVDGVRRGGSQRIETQTEIRFVQYQELVILMKINSIEDH